MLEKVVSRKILGSSLRKVLAFFLYIPFQTSFLSVWQISDFILFTIRGVEEFETFKTQNFSFFGKICDKKGRGVKKVVFCMS